MDLLLILWNWKEIFDYFYDYSLELCLMKVESLQRVFSSRETRLDPLHNSYREP